jgi:hypothetical protein
MAAAMEKNELYIISEFVDGSNLEDLLFSSEEVNLSRTTKDSIAKQLFAHFKPACNTPRYKAC